MTDTYTSAILFGTELRADGSSSKPYTVFQVMVSRGQDQWVVLRPHSLFTALHAKLKDKFAYAVKRQNLRIPKGKKLRSAPSPVVISRVHRKLQRYLVGLFSEPQLRTSLELDQFLSAGQQPINEYMHILQPFLDTICQLGEIGEAPEPKTSPRGEVLSYATDKGMQGVAEGGLIGLDVRLSGYLAMNQKGQWRDRFFQLRGTNALFMFSSAKDSIPLKLYNLCGCKLALAQGEDVEGAKASDHCFRMTWTKLREGKEAKKSVITFATRSEEDLGAWVSHLNNFALARADALIRKRVPDLPLLCGKSADELDTGDGEVPAKPERKSIAGIIRRKSHHQLQHHHQIGGFEGKGKECKGDRGHKKSATMNVVMALNKEKQEKKKKQTDNDAVDKTKLGKSVGPLHKSADERDVYRVLKRSGSDYGAKVRTKVQTPTQAQAQAQPKAASAEDQPGASSPNTAKRRHKRSSSMIDRKTMLIHTTKASQELRLDLTSVEKKKNKSESESEKVEDKETEKAEPKPASEEHKGPAASPRIGSVKEAMARSKRSIGSFLQSRPVFSSHPTLPIGKVESGPTRMRSASHVVTLRPSSPRENESIAFVNQLLDGLAEDDEAQVDLEGLQAEVRKFLTPAVRNGLEPLCGHTHQLSFIAVHSIQSDEAKLRVIDALLGSLPQANRATMLRLLSFLDRTAVRMGQASLRAAAEDKLQLEEAERQRQRAQQAKHQPKPTKLQADRKRDMYRVLKKRRPTVDHGHDAHHLFASPSSSSSSSADEFLLSEMTLTSPSTSFSSLSSSLSSTCSCASVASLDGEGHQAGLTDSNGCGALVCYSARIERELAEERERIQHQRKADEMKRKIDAMSHMLTTDTANAGLVELDDDKKKTEEEEAGNEEKENIEAHVMAEREAEAVVQFREKLARVFGRVIVACDRLPHVTLPSVAHHGPVDDQAAVVSVSTFLIEHCEQWLRGDKLAEKKEKKDEEKKVSEDDDDESRDNGEAVRMKLKMREMEERRARKLAMVALARQKKEERMDEIRKRNEEAEAKTCEDPHRGRARSQTTVA